MATMYDVVQKMISLDIKPKIKNQISNGINSSLSNDSIFKQGVISNIQQDGKVSVNIEGSMKFVTPEIDETLQRGQKVWIAKTVTDEFILIGAVRK